MPKLVRKTNAPKDASDASHWSIGEPPGQHVRLWHGHVVDVLRGLPDRAVQSVITSPPYWGLRDYGTGTWEGGDPNHAHRVRDARSISGGLGKQWTNRGSNEVRFGDCACGARRIDFQIGSEPSPDCGTHGQAQCGGCFVCSMVAVFREVRRVLRNDGVLWLNLGDTYNHGGGGGTKLGDTSQRHGRANVDAQKFSSRRPASEGLAAGNLCMVPARTALALQADGWVLRSDVPWIKVNSMPESAVNRPGKALEYFFMLTKGVDYYFDMVGIRKNSARPDLVGRTTRNYGPQTKGQMSQSKNVAYADKRNFRNADLWFASVNAPHGTTGVGDEIVGLDVPVGSYKGAHFATFSTRLIEPLLLSSTSDVGACVGCGAPWQRVVETVGGAKAEEDDRGERDRSITSNRNGITGSLDGEFHRKETLGWEPSCPCGAKSGIVPCVVLDPFVGSGTTAALSLALGRSAWGIDLSAEYLEQHAIPRVSAAWHGPRRDAGEFKRAGRALPVEAMAPTAARIKLGR